jgi:hypothetical protein
MIASFFTGSPFCCPATGQFVAAERALGSPNPAIRVGSPTRCLNMVLSYPRPISGEMLEAPDRLTDAPFIEADRMS